jgi:hypothetical protein
MTHRGICATTIKNKEREAERELVEYLEEVSAGAKLGDLHPGLMGQIADELYPETAVVKVKEEDDDAEVDLEEMLKRELQSMVVQPKSTRFREFVPSYMGRY